MRFKSIQDIEEETSVYYDLRKMALFTFDCQFDDLIYFPSSSNLNKIKLQLKMAFQTLEKVPFSTKGIYFE